MLYFMKHKIIFFVEINEMKNLENKAISTKTNYTKGF